MLSTVAFACINKLRNFSDTKALIKVILKMDLITSTSNNKREEEEMRLEREHRWVKTHSRWDIVPAVMRDGPKVVLPRTDILQAFSDAEFKEIYRFEKATFLAILDIIKADLPTGRNAIPPENRLGIFLSYVGGNEHQVNCL